MNTFECLKLEGLEERCLFNGENNEVSQEALEDANNVFISILQSSWGKLKVGIEFSSCVGFSYFFDHVSDLKPGYNWPQEYKDIQQWSDQQSDKRWIRYTGVCSVSTFLSYYSDTDILSGIILVALPASYMNLGISIYEYYMDHPSAFGQTSLSHMVEFINGPLKLMLSQNSLNFISTNTQIIEEKKS